MTPDFFDTHAHLQDSQFGEDFSDVAGRASQAGVTSLVMPAVDLQTTRAAIALSSAREGRYATAGYHPHEAQHLDGPSLAEIDALLSCEGVVAVGECGLDYYRMHSSRDAQLDAFDKMLALAERHAMPVVVHCRDAWDDMQAVLQPWAARVGPLFEDSPPGVMHYFTGTPEQAQFYAGLGFLISVHTSVTHPKSSQLRDAVAALPLDALVIETDSPYGAPQAHRGKRNEPAYVVEGASQIAAIKNVSLEDVAETTTANAHRLFRIPVAVSAARSSRP